MLSLKELKAQNAAEENAQATETVEEIEEVIEVEETEEAQEEVSEELEGDPKPEDESEPKSTEAWMEEDSEDEVAPKFRSSDISAAKKKLRAKLERQHNEETETLKAEIEALKQQVNTPQPKLESKPRPKYQDFESDEAFNDALDAWYDEKVEAKFSSRDSKLAQESKIREAQQKVIQSVDQHYERAAKLTQDHSINADIYRSADESVRRMAESVNPGKGDLIVDQLISRIGEGSEKVMYYVGRNGNALNELQSALISDPSGLQAAILIGQMKAKVTMPTKRQSNAPKPNTQLKGDESVVEQGRNLKKKYQAAHKAGNNQEAFSLRRQAKKAGVNVSDWG